MPLTVERKRLIQEAIREHGFTRKFKVIEHFKNHSLFQMSDRNFRDLITFDFEDIIDSGHVVKGRSVLKDAEGNIKLEWVKTSADKDKVLEATKIAVEELTATIKPIKPTKKPKGKLNKNLCNQYTITDYHIGMLAIAEESGEDWDIETAEQLIIDWFSQGIKNSPKAETCVFAQIGDFLHFDSIDPVTPSSGHVLDVSTRYTCLVRIAIRVIRKIILMLLKKYKTVQVVLAEGNHDISSSIWLREAFGVFFEDEPRVIIDRTMSPYYCFEFGSTLLFYHHGHKKNISNLDSTLVAMYKEQFGKAKYVYAHSGHYHHEHKKETNLMILEQHPTLSAKDAYSVRGGYHSKRNAKIITYSKEFGEVGRLTISPEMCK